jgi:hypothetical protein
VNLDLTFTVSSENGNIIAVDETAVPPIRMDGLGPVASQAQNNAETVDFAALIGKILEGDSVRVEHSGSCGVESEVINGEASSEAVEGQAASTSRRVVLAGERAIYSDGPSVGRHGFDAGTAWRTLRVGRLHEHTTDGVALSRSRELVPSLRKIVREDCIAVPTPSIADVMATVSMATARTEAPAVVGSLHDQHIPEPLLQKATEDRAPLHDAVRTVEPANPSDGMPGLSPDEWVPMQPGQRGPTPQAGTPVQRRTVLSSRILRPDKRDSRETTDQPAIVIRETSNEARIETANGEAPSNSARVGGDGGSAVRLMRGDTRVNFAQTGRHAQADRRNVIQPVAEEAAEGDPELRVAPAPTTERGSTRIDPAEQESVASAEPQDVKVQRESACPPEMAPAIPIQTDRGARAVDVPNEGDPGAADPAVTAPPVGHDPERSVEYTAFRLSSGRAAEISFFARLTPKPPALAREARANTRRVSQDRVDLQFVRPALNANATPADFVEAASAHRPEPSIDHAIAERNSTRQKPDSGDTELQGEANSPGRERHGDLFSDPSSPAVSERPSQAAARADRPITERNTGQSELAPSNRTREPENAPPARAMTRNITIEIGGRDRRPIQVTLHVRDGRVHVEVRATDKNAAGALRTELSELAYAVEARGYQIDTWTPSDTAPGPFHWDGSPQNDHSPGSNGEHRGQQHSHGGDDEHRRKQADDPEWLLELQRRLSGEEV